MTEEPNYDPEETNMECGSCSGPVFRLLDVTACKQHQNYSSDCKCTENQLPVYWCCWCNSKSSFAFPRLCDGCGEELEEHQDELCDDCENEL